MTLRTSDPLLTAARYAVGGLMGIFAFAAGAITIGLGAVLTVQRQELLTKLAANNIPAEGFNALLLILVCALVVMVLIAFFLRELWGIVASVRQGDPFVPGNADRLRTMGWLSLATQPMMWALSGASAWFHHFAKVAAPADDFSFSGGGLLLALVLFVLARVFRVGTAMREELEGTV